MNLKGETLSGLTAFLTEMEVTLTRRVDFVEHSQVRHSGSGVGPRLRHDFLEAWRFLMCRMSGVCGSSLVGKSIAVF